jgi:hypothetical protein
MTKRILIALLVIAVALVCVMFAEWLLELITAVTKKLSQLP